MPKPAGSRPKLVVSDGKLSVSIGANLSADYQSARFEMGVHEIPLNGQSVEDVAPVVVKQLQAVFYDEAEDVYDGLLRFANEKKTQTERKVR